MKKIGLIGGLGPESTLTYYRRIIDAFREKGAEGYPEMIIYSADLYEAIKIFDTGDRGLLTDWLAEKILTLHSAGAEFAAICSNTPHVVFDEIRKRSPIPLVSIVESTVAKTMQLGLKKPGFMGTMYAMKHGFYQKACAEKGITVVMPDDDDKELISQRIFTELEMGILKDSTREELLGVLMKMKEKQGIDSLILGCTELPLILDQPKYHGIPVLDTAAIHADKIIEYCLMD